MQVGAGLVALALLTGGCMPMEEKVVPTREDARYTCDAAKVQAMVGKAATQENASQAVRASGARTMRWIRPDSAYTMDYRTDRLNIHLDARNRITRVTCG